MTKPDIDVRAPAKLARLGNPQVRLVGFTGDVEREK